VSKEAIQIIAIVAMSNFLLFSSALYWQLMARRARRAYSTLRDYVGQHASFKNGNTMNGSDEGEAMAARMIEATDREAGL